MYISIYTGFKYNQTDFLTTLLFCVVIRPARLCRSVIDSRLGTIRHTHLCFCVSGSRVIVDVIRPTRLVLNGSRTVTVHSRVQTKKSNFSGIHLINV